MSNSDSLIRLLVRHFNASCDLNFHLDSYLLCYTVYQKVKYELISSESLQIMI